jgi:thiamine-phosphate pyrophosphorylase
MPELQGLYGITPDGLNTESLLAQVGAAMSGGLRWVQYRQKTATQSVRQEQARALAALCHAAGARLIVNDDLELALAVDADGVHLGAEDGDLAAARARLRPGMVLGASCYADLTCAHHAVSAGADYVAFGAVYPSAVKPGAVVAPLALLGEARRSLRVPVAAIGGITLERVADLRTAGADLLAVITDLFTAPDIRARAAAFQQAFSTSPAPADFAKDPS